MFPAKKVALLLALVILLYTLFSLPWPGVQRGYARLIGAVSSKVFQRFGDVGFIQVQSQGEYAPELKKSEIRILIFNPQQQLQKSMMTINARTLGYNPTVFLLALILVSPISRRRKLLAIVLGGLIMTLLILLKVYILCCVVFVKAGLLFIGEIGWIKALALVSRLLVSNTVVRYIFPLLIWALLCFRREDLTRLISAAQQPRERELKQTPAD